MPLQSAHYSRTNVTFASSNEQCGGWLYLPHDASSPRPAIVMGHGLGAIKEMGLDNYATEFAEAGYVVLVFDYRHFGASSGQPRQLLDINKQLADWAAAIAYARTLPQADPAKIALFGSSFGGGHVIVAAARDQKVAAVISQCPFTSGLASSQTLGIAATLKVSALATRDWLHHLIGAAPVTVPLAGNPGSAALMNAPDAMAGYNALKPADVPVENEVAARIAWAIPFYHPGRSAAQVNCPILFCVCEPDTVAPSAPTLRYANKAPKGEVINYPFGHFDIYQGDHFKRAVADQLAFLRRHLPV